MLFLACTSVLCAYMHCVTGQRSSRAYVEVRSGVDSRNPADVQCSEYTAARRRQSLRLSLGHWPHRQGYLSCRWPRHSPSTGRRGAAAARQATPRQRSPRAGWRGQPARTARRSSGARTASRVGITPLAASAMKLLSGRACRRSVRSSSRKASRFMLKCPDQQVPVAEPCLDSGSAGVHHGHWELTLP